MRAADWLLMRARLDRILHSPRAVSARMNGIEQELSKVPLSLKQARDGAGGILGPLQSMRRSIASENEERFLYMGEELLQWCDENYELLAGVPVFYGLDFFDPARCQEEEDDASGAV